jgi:hypothetical protein
MADERFQAIHTLFGGCEARVSKGNVLYVEGAVRAWAEAHFAQRDSAIRALEDISRGNNAASAAVAMLILIDHVLLGDSGRGLTSTLQAENSSEGEGK